MQNGAEQLNSLLPPLPPPTTTSKTFWVPRSVLFHADHPVRQLSINSFLSDLTVVLFTYPRIYSKFSAKKMLELSEAGLMNFLLLFLVVARRVELEDVASRACELLSYLPSKCPAGHRTLVWRGQFSMLLLFQVVLLELKYGF